ncbi:MAG: EAL domain-containing protein [Actinobacteria bacterium]|nr:EAL domain-containing protein [Actinomycetota bacterium]
MSPPPAQRSPVGESELERLRGQLERERRARREVEEIAEKATRDLYERQSELELLHAVAVAANEAATVEDALQEALDRVCEHTGWPVGHVYLLDSASGALKPSSIWHLGEPRECFEPFRHATESTILARGVGLPGRVLESGSPAWVADLQGEPGFPRARVAADTGVRAGFAFPVSTQAGVVAVLEFFAREAAQPDRGLLERMARVGTQLRQVVERKQGEDELRRLSRQNELLLDAAGEGIYGLDADGRATFVNPAAARMLGGRPADLVGRHAHELVHGASTRHAADECRTLRALREAEVQRVENDVFVGADGESFPVAYIATPLLEGAEVVGAVVTFNDVSERKRVEGQLQYLADHDALTGLYNRRRFEEEVLAHVDQAARYGTSGAILTLDLDDFKYVNDTFGHAAGDAVVRGVADLLRGNLRTSDLIARLGGDEFAVLLRQVDLAGARVVAEDLRERVRRFPLGTGGAPLRVTTSIGLTAVGDRQVTGQELLVEADVALYEAKEGGRDAVGVYAPGEGRRGGLQVSLPWVERIRGALEQGRFVLYEQPIVDLQTGRISQHELLLRMREEDGTILAPEVFLPIAERFGLIGAIDRWVIGEAIRLCGEPRAIDLPFEINLSGRSLGDPELLEYIERQILAGAVDPASLVFEITETAAIANMDEAQRFAYRLAGLGCRFALDDFGAGFGSFSYLKYLPLDMLKIDGDFIAHLPESPIDQRMVRAMVEVARGLGLQTIAEFVGNADTVRLLRDYGVDYGQGFHLGRPRPVSELMATSSRIASEV